MSIFDNYGKRILNKDTQARSRKIEQAKYGISKKFEEDPSYFWVNAIEPDGITSSTKKLRIVNADYVTHLNPARVNSRYFIGHPEDKFLSGTVLFDLYESDWMVISSANLTSILDRGMLQKINFIGKWISEGNIYENYAVITGVSRRSDGIDENYYMVIPDDSILLSFPKNNTTSTLKRDARLLVYGMPYKITRIDAYTDPNTYYMIAKEDQIGPNDNIELGICDYYQQETSEEIAIRGDTYITHGSTYKYFVANLPENDTILYWTIASGNSYIKTFSTSNAENYMKIDLLNDPKIVGKTITIGAILQYAGTLTKTLTITSLL